MVFKREKSCTILNSVTDLKIGNLTLTNNNVTNLLVSDRYSDKSQATLL